MRKIRMQILMDPDAKKKLEQQAKSRNISVGQVIREAVEFYGRKPLEKPIPKDDPIWEIVGAIQGLPKKDYSGQHDRYIYGKPVKRRGGR